MNDGVILVPLGGRAGGRDVKETFLPIFETQFQHDWTPARSSAHVAGMAQGLAMLLPRLARSRTRTSV